MWWLSWSSRCSTPFARAATPSISAARECHSPSRFQRSRPFAIIRAPVFRTLKCLAPFKVKAFVAQLNKCAAAKNCALFTFAELLDAAAKMPLEVDDFHAFVDLVNDQAYILKKGPRLYQLVTAVASSSQASQGYSR